MNTHAEIGSPWCAPLCKGKYRVLMPSFTTHDSWLFNNALTQETKFLLKPIFLKYCKDELMI